MRLPHLSHSFRRVKPVSLPPLPHPARSSSAPKRLRFNEDSPASHEEREGSAHTAHSGSDRQGPMGESRERDSYDRSRGHCKVVIMEESEGEGAHSDGSIRQSEESHRQARVRGGACACVGGACGRACLLIDAKGGHMPSLLLFFGSSKVSGTGLVSNHLQLQGACLDFPCHTSHASACYSVYVSGAWRESMAHGGASICGGAVLGVRRRPCVNLVTLWCTTSRHL